jgi:hypothetical protein
MATSLTLTVNVPAEEPRSAFDETTAEDLSLGYISPRSRAAHVGTQGIAEFIDALERSSSEPVQPDLPASHISPQEALAEMMVDSPTQLSPSHVPSEPAKPAQTSDQKALLPIDATAPTSVPAKPAAPSAPFATYPTEPVKPGAKAMPIVSVSSDLTSAD